MNEKPLISIVIPIWNQASKIGDCLASILLQSHSNWETIVVNDGSTDAIDTVMAEWQTKFPAGRLQYVTQEHANGNVALKPRALETMFETLKSHPEASFAYSSFMYGPKLFRLFPYDAVRLRRMPYIHASSLIRRAHFPGFDNDLKRFQDWDLWLTMLEHGHTGVWIDEPLFMVKPAGSISAWIPKITYRLLPFLKLVKKYNEARDRIYTKHHLV
jgi:glycosyltransferase involved in cell wall biosynthesis